MFLRDRGQDWETEDGGCQDRLRGCNCVHVCVNLKLVAAGLQLRLQPFHRFWWDWRTAVIPETTKLREKRNFVRPARANTGNQWLWEKNLTTEQCLRACEFMKYVIKLNQRLHVCVKAEKLTPSQWDYRATTWSVCMRNLQGCSCGPVSDTPTVWRKWWYTCLHGAWGNDCRRLIKSLVAIVN